MNLGDVERHAKSGRMFLPSDLGRAAVVIGLAILDELRAIRAALASSTADGEEGTAPPSTPGTRASPSASSPSTRRKKV